MNKFTSTVIPTYSLVHPLPKVWYIPVLGGYLILFLTSGSRFFKVCTIKDLFGPGYLI